MAAACREVIVVLRQSHRTFVETVDFITSVGYGDGPGARERLGLTGPGPKRVITDLGVLQPDPRTCELVLTELYPGGSVKNVQDHTPSDPPPSAPLPETPPPSHPP